jgi:hypothetical protein
VTPRAKKCKVCTEPFVPRQPMQRVCGVDCAKAEAVRIRQHAEKKADRAKREKLKPRADWLKEAQTAFNAWVRERDDALPCISCGRHHQGQWHAGHYLSTGARPELRFHPDNVHKQCQPCNTHLHGNLVLYRLALIEKIGLDRVEWLEGPHEPQKWSIDDLKAIKAEYSRKAKELKQ